MSLHYKIVWLFIGVAILPLLILAAVARQQSLAAADFASEADIMARAAGVARYLSEEAAVAEATLRALAHLPPDALTSSYLQEVLEARAGPQPVGFEVLEVADSAGGIRASGGRPREGSVCRGNRLSSLVRLELPLSGGGGVLRGAYRPGWGAGFQGGGGLWVYDGDGTLLAASPCGSDPGVPAEVLGSEVGGGILNEGGLRAGTGTTAFARVYSRDWAVVAAGGSALREALAGLFRSYWLFVLVLAGTAVLAFSILLRQVTGSVADLTRAAERVAAGDLRPWLPAPRDDEMGRLTLAFSEMTDRLRDMVAQVDRTGRLAVLGKLSAYLAHEIRNPLSAVKMNLQRLQRWQQAGELPERAAGPIEVSLNEVGRLATAVSNILQLAPGKPAPREIVSLHALVSDAARLLDSEFTRSGVGLRWELNAELDRVAGQPGPLKGVVINLMLNALDAQPNGGQLLIRSALRPGTEADPGPKLELRFRDFGPGVPPEIQGRIFEPFFTTKEGGSGVGLAVVAQTIRDHGGELYLEDRLRVDDGAEFVIRLPLAAVAGEESEDPTEPDAPHWAGKEVDTRRPLGGSDRIKR